MGEAMDDFLSRLRALCLSLPETTERLSHDTPTWFVRDKRVFVIFSAPPGDAPIAFWCPAPVGVQAALLAAQPARFFAPPYVGPRGWIGVVLDPEVDRNEVGEIVREAYRLVAPKRLVAAMDASGD